MLSKFAVQGRTCAEGFWEPLERKLAPLAVLLW